MGTAPLPQPKILHPTDITVGDAGKIADHQGADPLPDGESDHQLGGLVLALVDAAAVASLSLALPVSITPPASRVPLPWLRRSAGRTGLAGLLVVQMQVTLGPQCTARHHEPGVLRYYGVRMDDAKVDTGYPIRVQVMLLHRNGGSDRKP
jgi:hypothetical protein